jgi:2-C-methyl-D-erythritol 4-phosphate cytidylyltransferase
MISALIVAAGKGLRMGAAQRKQYLQLCDRPLLVHTLQAFDQCSEFQTILLVVPKTEMEFCEKEILPTASLNHRVKLIAGGRRRQDSVFNGLQYLGDGQGVVLIHDGVRPLVSMALIRDCIQGAMQWGACLPVVQAVDTLKQIDSHGNILCTMSRESIRMAQTPQAFSLAIILRAHREARRLNREATDDASLVEALGVSVHAIAGSRENIKITTPEDLAYAEALLKLRSKRFFMENSLQQSGELS